MRPNNQICPTIAKSEPFCLGKSWGDSAIIKHKPLKIDPQRFQHATERALIEEWIPNFIVGVVAMARTCKGIV